MPIETNPKAHPSDNKNEPSTERQRMDAVHRYAILDTPPDGAFDHITAIAAQVLSVPVAIVSIVDHDRIWFKSHHGVRVEQVGRDAGLCASCILQDGPWIVNDAKADPRALANPLVAGEFGAQFYLGIPLRTHDGFNLGTVCVLDFVPRVATQQDVSVLTHLASVVMDELELRLSALNAISEYQQELGRREEREQHIRALMRELAHRSKNLLAVVQAIARQMATKNPAIADYVSRLADRIHGLAQTHDLIADEDWHGVSLDDLMARQITPLVGEEHRRVHCSGPRVILSPIAAQHLGLALHELATNAIKHGALSGPQGKIEVTWHHGPPRLHITWCERDGPATEVPLQKGFGYLVLSRLTPDALDGKATLAFDRAGVSWKLDIPSTHLL